MTQRAGRTVNMTTPRKWTKEELAARGIDERGIIDRSSHPMSTAMTWDITPQDAHALGAKGTYHYSHIKPESVFIAAIGNLWVENAWWRLQDMMLYSASQGYSISLQEIKAGNLFSEDAIFTMRWCAAMMALDAGVEWLLMVDNDVLLEKDTLVRLLAHDRPIVYPLLNDLEQRYPIQLTPLSAPADLKPGTGLQPVLWSAMSVMLFNPRIFNVLDANAWKGTDYQFGQCLNHIGHRIYVDTDTVVAVAKSPTRLAMRGYDAFWDGHRSMYDRLRTEERDRRPPPGFNPEEDDGWLDEHGTYFAVPNPRKAAMNGATKEKLWHPSS